MSSVNVQIAALYVGDLHPDVTESLLLEKFSSVGQVHSVRLCKAMRPGTSNKYAFVNFQHETDAERALDLLNFDILLGQPMRIMWSNRNPFLRNSNMGNIFIKGLEKSIDSRALYDTFSNFGKVLSCKVVCDEQGSRGYGYVHFENAEAAETAMKILNGTLFNDLKVFITHFKSHQERQAANRMTAIEHNCWQVHVSQAQREDEGQPKIQNTYEPAQNPTVGKNPTTVMDATVYPVLPATVYPVLPAVYPVTHPLNPVPVLYIGDLHPDVTESLLLEKFSSVGQVLSIRLCRARRPDTSNNYAFISFQHWTDAEHALDLLNYDILLGQPMRIMWSNKNSSLRNSNTGNIFIKGLEKSIDSLALYDIFSEFGHVLSCKVVCDEHGSRGYGYVHFENAEAAETAIKNLNGTLFKDHKVFITHFKSHQERQTANRMTAKGDSKQVHVSQAQKEEKGHPKIQNRFEQAQNPKTTVIDTVPAVVPAAFSSIPDTVILVPAAVNLVPDTLNPVPALYIGDLHPDVTESLLLETFSSVGQVLSIRLCRARRPDTSNNYAFINFQDETDAERALHLLNFNNLLGQPMRIMWSKRNTSLRNSNTGNIFIKGLEKSIDSLALYDIFTNFGNILSCKVVCDEHGSRGYGYVHFENAEDAETAIKNLNGTLFNDFKVFITHFKSRQERQAENKTAAKDDNKNQSWPLPKNKKKRKKKHIQKNLSQTGS